jgi:hypothetical protein
LGEDVEADPCAGTLDHGIEGTSPDQNQVLESPEVATGKFPAKKRKKTMHQRKTELAQRQSHAKNTRAGKNSEK